MHPSETPSLAGLECLRGPTSGPDYPPTTPPSGGGRAIPQATFPSGVLIVWQSQPSMRVAHTASSSGVVPTRPCSVAAFWMQMFSSKVFDAHRQSFSESWRQLPLHAGPRTSTQSTDAQRKYRDMGPLA